MAGYQSRESAVLSHHSVRGNLAYLMCGLAGLSPDLECQLVPSMVALAFTLIFVPLLAKTYVRPSLSQLSSSFTVLFWSSFR
jgi:hypothetical protein